MIIPDAPDGRHGGEGALKALPVPRPCPTRPDPTRHACDCDGLLDAADNCPGVANAEQEDSDVPTWTATGAAAVWKFEEASGTTALDSTGSYNCILTDASLRTASGRVGRAIRLNGYPDNCGSALNIDPADRQDMREKK